MTYRGHSVLRTLIRCHFSPAETTGSQYLYSGSADGRIHVRMFHEYTSCVLIFIPVDLVLGWHDSTDLGPFKNASNLG